MNITNKDLKRRILEISNKYQLSHIGSCLTAVDIIDEIFQTKKQDEKFVLSSGHAGLALYVVLEKYNNPEYGKSAEEMWLHHGVHPDRCSSCGIDCSSGSLGHGLPIAVGMALADRTKQVYCLVSDGECAEGSIFEAIRIAGEEHLENLHIYINTNGWGAYCRIFPNFLKDKLSYSTWDPFHETDFDLDIKFIETNVDYLPFLNLPDGQQAHYHAMTDEEYEEAIKILK